MPNEAVKNTRFGLKESTIARIHGVLEKFSGLEKAVLYGSRAKGRYRPGSDIDLTLLGDQLSYDQLGDIETKLDDLLLPYSFDISLFRQINNPDLIDHISRVGIVFYQKSHTRAA